MIKKDITEKPSYTITPSETTIKKAKGGIIVAKKSILFQPH